MPNLTPRLSREEVLAGWTPAAMHRYRIERARVMMLRSKQRIALKKEQAGLRWLLVQSPIASRTWDKVNEVAPA